MSKPATLWRISNHGDLGGMGGEKTDGRWHTAGRGKRIVYLSEHPALALIETLANLKGNPGMFPDTFQLVRINVGDSVSIATLPADALSVAWREDLDETQPAGDSWLASAHSALLEVPSAPSPESLNYLLNPLHHDATGILVEWRKRIEYDRRLFKVHELPYQIA